MKRHLTYAITPILVLAILAGCGASSFATQLRMTLAASGPLIGSLDLGDKKGAVVQDFSDLASGAADLSDDLKSCADNPCKLSAVSRYEMRFWDVLRRGHFKLSPKLDKIQEIMSGIIASAKVYYGDRPKTPRAAGSGPVPAPNAANDLNERLNALKEAMKAR